MTESTRLIYQYPYIFSDITDIYKATSNAGIKVIVQPSSLVGSPRISAGTFEDYWEHIIAFQKKEPIILNYFELIALFAY
jgi:hypothetical protein